MTVSTRAVGSVVALAVLATACVNYYEVPVETPLQPKLDVAGFQRVLVAGFVTGGSGDVDTNLETARLLKSQLRSNSEFQVIDADVLELTVVAEEQGGTSSFDDGGNGNGNGGTGTGTRKTGSGTRKKTSSSSSISSPIPATGSSWARSTRAR